MKRISYFLMAFVFAASACFTACQKDETENENATLDDFTGTYDVTITSISNIAEVLTGGATYENITMKVESVSASTLEQKIKTSSELLDVAAKSYLDSINWKSETLAKFTFTSANNGIDSNSWYPMLNDVYGYAKGGYVFMASPDIDGEHVLIFTAGMAYHDTKAATWTGYYLEKSFVLGLINEHAGDKNFDYTKFDWSSILTGDVNYTQLSFSATRK